MADIFQNRHFYEREMLLNVPDDDLGAVTLAGVVPKLSETPGSVVWSGHRIGQDTREVLKAFGHLTDEDIDAPGKGKRRLLRSHGEKQAIARGRRRS